MHSNLRFVWVLVLLRACFEASAQELTHAGQATELTHDTSNPRRNERLMVSSLAGGPRTVSSGSQAATQVVNPLPTLLTELLDDEEDDAQARNSIATTLLTPLWRVLVSGNDYMTTASLTERAPYPSEGAYAYVPIASSANTVPMYRLSETSLVPPDHRDSSGPGTGIYSTNGILGYPFASAATGLSQLINVSNSHDNATLNEGESKSGYSSRSPMPLWGYPRYNNNPTVLVPITSRSGTGALTFASNSVAGGAIWSWKWSGTEFVNTVDYGREIQAAIFYPGSDNKFHNPTEAGSGLSGPDLTAQDKQGSPIIYSRNTTASLHETRAIPLEWDPSSFGGGSANPVIYNQIQLGKSIYLDYLPETATYSVAKYVTHVVLPSTLNGAQIEIPTGYLLSSFNTFYTYDAGASAPSLNQVHPPQIQPPQQCALTNSTGFTPASGYGGVVISNSTGSLAMGVYGAMMQNGGSVFEFALFDFIYCYGASKWSAAYSGPVSAGETTYNTYIVTGTLDGVRVGMSNLYQGGAK